MRRPECEVCSEDCEPSEDNRIQFRRTDAGRKWAARAEDGDVVGDDPDVAWVCDKHRAPMKGLAPTCTLVEAVAKLAAASKTARTRAMEAHRRLDSELREFYATKRAIATVGGSIRTHWEMLKDCARDLAGPNAQLETTRTQHRTSPLGWRESARPIETVECLRWSWESWRLELESRIIRWESGDYLRVSLSLSLAQNGAAQNERVLISLDGAPDEMRLARFGGQPSPYEFRLKALCEQLALGE